MRFGQNAVRTPGRTHDNHCVTKGLKFRAALFKGLGAAHVRRTRRGVVPLGHRPRATPWPPSAEGETPLGSGRQDKPGRTKNNEAKKGRGVILS